ncbi:MAG: hypothetical protein ACREBG_09780 [Pyrinomonadaceae bacterium]
MQVKQHVAVVQNSRGARFRVFETGNPKFYLFSTIAPDGTEGGLQFPVRKTDLRDDIRRMLRYGYGNAS